MDILQFIIELVRGALALIKELTPVFLAWLSYLALKANRERADIKRELNEVGRAVNGITHASIVAAQVAGFDEGAKLEAGRSASPEAEAKAVARSDELTEASRVAASSASAGKKPKP